MKVSVITLLNVNNYGSVLQTYATKKTLEYLGCEVEFVDYWRANQTPKRQAEALLKSSTLKRLQPIWGCTAATEKMMVLLLEEYVKLHKAPTRRFLEKYITLTPQAYHSFEELQNNPPKADVYVTGSDQVWNSIWNEGVDYPLYLAFAPEGKKRIAFAASIGMDELIQSEIPEMQRLLQKYSAISMREASAVKQLSEIGISSELILDPTLMLDGKQWKELATFHEKKRQPYLLIYQLNKNTQMDDYAEELAARNHWDIIRIGYSRSARKKAGFCALSPSVEDFLGYFVNAEHILTDSFHATAFSLNLEKMFTVIMPPRFGTRIESILDLTGTQDRLLRNYQDFTIADRKYDTESAQEILSIERGKGIIFLKKALSL